MFRSMPSVKNMLLMIVLLDAYCDRLYEEMYPLRLIPSFFTLYNTTLLRSSLKPCVLLTMLQWMFRCRAKLKMELLYTEELEKDLW
jgi:hypothetical protein